MSWRTAFQIVGPLASALINIVRLDTSVPKAEKDEESSFDELEVINSPTTKVESLERTLDRAESVLEGQLTILAETHDRAVRMVRVEVVLLGAIASVAQITPNPISVNVWLEASGVLLIGSIIVGIFTSNSSSPDFGPGPNYVRSNIESGDSNDELYLQLLRGYSEAISYNSEVVSNSATYLFISQLMLIGGVVLGSIGILAVR